MIQKRGNFSRRRQFVEEKEIDYINERNRKFNEKLERNYKQYSD
jgi:pre-mRNA-splicing factor SYF2